MVRLRNIILLFIISSIILYSCRENPTDISKFSTTPYELILPKGLPKPTLPADNPLTKEGILLGNKLFFDTRLSGDNTQSCASCHNQEFAFSDNGKKLSTGIRGLEGRRNSMPIFNMFYHNVGFFWDGRARLLRHQTLKPIEDDLEMDDTLANVIKKLKETDFYPTLFYDAFGTTEITEERISLALEQYMLTLVSGNSKYDRVMNDLEQFTESEQRGYYIFFTPTESASPRPGADCFHCHSGANFSNNDFMNNGLDKEFKDLGYGEFTKQAFDNGKFKVPSLRNVAVTFPYMHDGRFATLEDVVEHYNSGVVNSPTIDPNMHSFESGLNLSNQNKIDLVNFLKTLTDDEFLINPEYKQK